MARGLKDGEPNGRDLYADIIDHPHWQSPSRPHMSLCDRAAQFSSFDALAGYSDMVEEEQRTTGRMAELTESSLEELNRELCLIAAALDSGKRPAVSITYFLPDEHKDGGSYVTITDEIIKIDTIHRKVVLASAADKSKMNRTIDFDRISDLFSIKNEKP